MRYIFKNLLFPSLLLPVCASAMLLVAGGEPPRGAHAETPTPATAIAASFRRSSLVFKETARVEASGSTILKGKVLNSMDRSVDHVTFEVKAYDREGNLLRGAEERTIFRVSHLGPHSSAPVNSGYGVWLQGISRDRVATVEVSELPARDSFAARSIPFADHAIFWKEYSEIEE